MQITSAIDVAWLASWQRADVISVVAAAISAIALLVSLLAARYTAVQAGVARRKERAEAADQRPVVEANVGAEHSPGWRTVNVFIRNRIDEPILCERLRIIKPRKAKLALRRDYVTSGLLIESRPPPLKRHSDSVELDIRLREAGSAVTLLGHQSLFDRTHESVLVWLPSTAPSSDLTILSMSLSVRRTNESVPYAEIMVVTKIPPVSTRTDA